MGNNHGGFARLNAKSIYEMCSGVSWVCNIGNIRASSDVLQRKNLRPGLPCMRVRARACAHVRERAYKRACLRMGS